jgi:hypothetical protein
MGTMKASTPSSYIPQSLLGTQIPGWETLQQHFILAVWFLFPSLTKDSNRMLFVHHGSLLLANVNRNPHFFTHGQPSFM